MTNKEAVMSTRHPWRLPGLAVVACLLAPAAVAAEGVTPFSTAVPGEPPAPWRVVSLFKGKKPLTQFDIAQVDGSRVLRVEAQRSYGTLVHNLPAKPPAPGTLLRWRWRLDEPLLGADLRRKSGDDSPLKVCVLFDMPIDRLGFMDRQMLRMGRSISGEELPSATLCYVWDHALPPGTLLRNAFTASLRMVVLDSGEKNLRRWIVHERDIHADFLRAFGSEDGMVPPLEGILIGADADNTADRSLGFVGDIMLGARAATASVRPP
jgi:Protein of unknown function (DUF3047)